MSGITQDFRLGLRMIAQQPALSISVILMLALGLGVNGAIFGSIDALVLRPYPVKDADRMVMIAQTTPRDVFEFVRQSVSPADFLDWRRQSDVFSNLAAYRSADVNLKGQDEPERVRASFVTAGFFEVLGSQPALGRPFSPDEEELQNQHRLVLSHGLWMRRFAGDRSILGRQIEVDGVSHTVLGVAAPDFDFPKAAELWAPLAFSPNLATNRATRFLTVIGRLNDGVSIEDARAQMEVIAGRLKQQYPETNKNLGLALRTINEGLVDPGSPAFLGVMQAAALLVLLIACANVANLLLARGKDRSREFAVRAALGGSRGRLLRQLLCEGLILALAAAAASLLFASVGLDLIRTSMPATIEKYVVGWQELGLDGRLIAVTFLGAIVTSLLFGFLPALHFSKPNLNDSLKQNRRSGAAGPGRQRGRNALAIAQIALALGLLVTAGLCISGTIRMVRGPQGFDPDNLLTVRFTLPSQPYEQAERRRQFVSNVLERIAASPGVQTASATNIVPASGNNTSRTISIEGEIASNPADRPSVDYRSVTTNYFETLRIPILEGRGFTEFDLADSSPVAVVSRSMANRFWMGQNAIGKRFRVGADDAPWLTVVGISGDVIQHWLTLRNAPTMYRPFAQDPRFAMVLAVRTLDEPSLHTSAIRNAVAYVDPAQPVYEAQTMRRVIADSTVGMQYAGAMMGVMGALALVLSALGVYSVITYLVSQRKHEIGVRMALGAGAHEIMQITFARTARLTIMGVAIGAVLAFALASAMASALYGAVRIEIPVFLFFSALLTAVALLAGYVPSRRALSVDPIQVLREE